MKKTATAATAVKDKTYNIDVVCMERIYTQTENKLHSIIFLWLFCSGTVMIGVSSIFVDPLIGWKSLKPKLTKIFLYYTSPPPPPRK